MCSRRARSRHRRAGRRVGAIRAAALTTVRLAVLPPIEMEDEFLGGLVLLELDHAVGFQSQAFPDRSFHAHRLSTPVLELGRQSRIAGMPDALWFSGRHVN